MGAVARGACPVCRYRFADATDQEFQHRLNYHLTMSVRHQKYLAAQTIPRQPNEGSKAV